MGKVSLVLPGRPRPGQLRFRPPPPPRLAALILLPLLGALLALADGGFVPLPASFWNDNDDGRGAARHGTAGLPGDGGCPARWVYPAMGVYPAMRPAVRVGLAH